LFEGNNETSTKLLDVMYIIINGRGISGFGIN